MKFGRIFIFMLCQILFLACSDAEGSIYTEEELRLCFIEGHITDQEGIPIEKIRITIESESFNFVSKHYTSSAGFFHCELELPEEYEQMVLDITIDDIDGEDNGGLFESKTEVINIFKADFKDRPVFIKLPTCRLNHATASESSPQS